jgi:hypothetical protein
MLERTFLHVPGIGPKREGDLWRRGFTDWTRFRDGYPDGPWRDLVLDWLEPERAARALPRREAWRLATEFPGRTAFLDIETEGLADADGITCIGLSDGETVQAFVAGDNLAAFPYAMDRFDMVVTYNGACFDLPVLQRAFPGIDFGRYHHIDLRYTLHRLGVKGGLKGAERTLGIARPGEIEGVDGFLAVLLWREHRRGHPTALETLLRYCLEDVVHLKTILAIAYNRLVRTLPLDVPEIVRTDEPPVPYGADGDLVRRLLRVRETAYF